MICSRKYGITLLQNHMAFSLWKDFSITQNFAIILVLEFPSLAFCKLFDYSLPASMLLLKVYSHFSFNFLYQSSVLFLWLLLRSYL